jgi:carbon-monoxide dehydrogenase small subunit
MSKKNIVLKINGKRFDLRIDIHRTLLEVLRDKLNLTGTKYGCGEGECGTCTVLVNGKPRASCITLAHNMEKKDIFTIEGLSESGDLDPIQKAFISHGAIQCGFCTPGMIMTTKALLDEKSSISEEDVKEYLSGNLCRCTGYVRIMDAILSLAS